MITRRIESSILLSLCLVLLNATLGATAAHAALPGDPTLGERATQALTDRDIDGAVSLFERWLEADPNRPIDWYNFACALSLRGESGRAVEALRNAMTAGYHSADWTSQDSDLESLREIPEFQEILEEMARLSEADELSRAGLRHLPQARLGSYLLRLPEIPAEAATRLRPLIVLLHGRGGNPEGFARLAEGIGLPDMIYALPQAPYLVPDQPNGFQYWPEELRRATSDPEAMLASHLEAEWLRDLVRDIARHQPVDTTRVFLIGFSQGAAMTYVAALEHPGLFAGIAPLGGWIPESHRNLDRMRALAASGVSLFIGHGEQDTAVPLDEAEVARRLASEAGVATTIVRYPVAHEIPDPMVEDLRHWISEVCGQAR